jgi:HSP20 family protein
MRFDERVQLPYSVDAERVEATFRDGVLAVTLPRAQSDMPRKIAIKSAT